MVISYPKQRICLNCLKDSSLRIQIHNHTALHMQYRGICSYRPSRMYIHHDTSLGVILFIKIRHLALSTQRIKFILSISFAVIFRNLGFPLNFFVVFLVLLVLYLFVCFFFHLLSFFSLAFSVSFSMLLFPSLVAYSSSPKYIHLLG